MHPLLERKRANVSMVAWEKGSDERSTVICSVRKAVTSTVMFVEEEEGRRNNLLGVLALDIFSTRWNSTFVSRFLNLFPMSVLLSPRRQYMYVCMYVCTRESFFVAGILTHRFNVHVHFYHISTSPTVLCNISMSRCTSVM